MRLKSVVLTLFVATVLFAVTGCSGAMQKKPVTIKMAYMQGQSVTKEQTEKIFEEFTKSNPTIKVDVTFIPAGGSGWNDYFTKIQTMIAGGNAPDICDVAIEGIRMFVSMGLAQPLDGFIKAHPDAIGDAFTDINPHLEVPFKIDGNTYGVVNNWNNVVMHFNTKLLKDAGLAVPKENWGKEDLLKYCAKLTKTVNGKKQFAISIPNYYFGAEAWLYNNHASVLNADMTKCTLNEPNSVEIFQLWQDMVQKYKYAPYPDPNVDAINQLITGQTAMGSWGRWPVQEYKNNNFTDVAVQYLTNFKTNVVEFGSGGTVVLKSSKHLDEASRVAIWMSSSYFIKNYYGYSAIPTRKSVADEVIPAAGVPQNYDLYYKTAEIAVPVQAPPQYAVIATIFDRYLSEILSKPVSVKDELDKATAEIDAVLAGK
jgi:multiple sugar transport system substrate-binding protein